MHHIYCALYFYYDDPSSTSDHQALDPGGQGLLLKRVSSVITPLPAPRIPFAPCAPQGLRISSPQSSGAFPLCVSGTGLSADSRWECFPPLSHPKAAQEPVRGGLSTRPTSAFSFSSPSAIPGSLQVKLTLETVHQRPLEICIP